MSGGFGRGKIIDDGSYFPESHFDWINNGTRGNRNENGSMRGSHRNNFSSGSTFDEYSRNNRENRMEHFTDSDFSSPFDTGGCVGNNRGTRTFMRGGRESTFSSNRKDGDRYSFDRENDFSSGFSAERRGGFSSGYGVIEVVVSILSEVILTMTEMKALLSVTTSTTSFQVDGGAAVVTALITAEIMIVLEILVAKQIMKKLFPILGVLIVASIVKEKQDLVVLTSAVIGVIGEGMIEETGIYRI